MDNAIIGLTIDRSGSMQSMWNEAVAGFNTFKNAQAAEDGHAWIILNYFDTTHGQKYYAWDAQHIPDLAVDDKEIYPRGLTALVDSTIRTIKDVDKWITENPSFDGKVFVVVVTDGIENASSAPASELKGLVEEKEKAGWEFIYLAANVDLEATRQQYGFGAGQSILYTGDTVGSTYNTLANSVTRSRSGGSAGFTEEERAAAAQSTS